MIYQEYLKKAIANLSEDRITLALLKETTIKANNDLSLDSNILDGLLAALENRMSTEDFINFCESL